MPLAPGDARGPSRVAAAFAKHPALGGLSPGDARRGVETERMRGVACAAKILFSGPSSRVGRSDIRAKDRFGPSPATTPLDASKRYGRGSPQGSEVTTTRFASTPP